MGIDYLKWNVETKATFSFRLTEDITRRIDRFQPKIKSRLEKINYLVRLFDMVDPLIEVVDPIFKERKARSHRSGNYLPEDVVLIIRRTAARYKISLANTIDFIIIHALECSKTYNLTIALEQK